jgi:RNA polymerase sigma factor
MQSVSVNRRVVRIKDNKEEINRFIEEYKPFIASCTKSITGRYMTYGSDDELSIALIAFAEAIKSFDSTRGNFFPFAGRIIRNRIIDYYRKEKQNNNFISLNEYYNGNVNKKGKELRVVEAIDTYSIYEDNDYRRMELEELTEELKKWNITFSDLVSSSPKQKRTRKIYHSIIKYITEEPELINIIHKKRQLPISELEKELHIPRKKFERARKYIIAMVIIVTGDYEYIRGYIDWEVG